MADQQIDPTDLVPRAVYNLMTSLVVPRPIAWVSTVDADGRRNLAPHSYFNMVSSDPPIVHFTSAGMKDTLQNVRATGEFVVNVVDRPCVEAMNLTAAKMPPEEDEFSWAGVEAVPSSRVRPARVASAPAALECRVIEVKPIGNGVMVFGEVLVVHVAERVWGDGIALPEKIEAVGRLGGSAYSPTNDVFHLPRPSWEDVRATADAPPE